MEANPIEAHMRAALRMRVLRDVELDEARRWSAVFGRATDDNAREFLRRQVEPHVVAARKFNRQMVKAQRAIRTTLESRECLDLIRATFAADWRASDGYEVVAGAPASIQGEEERTIAAIAGNVRSIERAPALVDGLVAAVIGRKVGARDADVGAVGADERRSAPRFVGRSDSRRRRQASRLIAFLLSIGASTSGCSMVEAVTRCDDCAPAPRWSERTTGEKVTLAAFSLVGLVALYAIVREQTDDDDGFRACVGDCGPSDDGTIPCVFADRDFPPGCTRN